MTIKTICIKQNIKSRISIHFLINSLILIILYYKKLILEIDYLEFLKKISILRYQFIFI